MMSTVNAVKMEPRVWNAIASLREHSVCVCVCVHVCCVCVGELPTTIIIVGCAVRTEGTMLACCAPRKRKALTTQHSSQCAGQ